MLKKRQDALPIWRGWQRLKYGPNARYTIPWMPPLYWHIMGRAFFKSVRPLGLVNEQIGKP